jgi:methylmalonyl-CoA/ethylmalonyl-CoA epimerase
MPLGVLDHIAVAVKSIATARRFYEDVLGGQFMYELDRPDKGYRLCKIELYRVAIELLEPLGADSFLHDYLAKRGEGLHHVAFNLPGSKWEAERLRQLGVTVIDDTDDAERHDAFISPRSSHGVLIQLFSGYSARSLAHEYEKKRQPVTLTSRNSLINGLVEVAGAF